jgi:molybdopterin-guanine dinucleotide biosynthesis protein B
MKAVGVVGYKKSGKTSLILRIAEKLSETYRVGIIKHAEELDEPSSDTQKFSETYPTGYVSPKKSGIIFPKEKSLEEISGYLNVDILLIEGFKGNRTFPKITCGEYEDDLAIASDDDDLATIVKKIEQTAFKLPNENCGKCGYDCATMASMIVRGEASVDQCQQLGTPHIRIGGKAVSLNPFVSNLVKNIITAIVDALKGTEKGTIEVTVERD